MPRPPNVTPEVAAMPGAIFSKLQARIQSHPGPLFPLHVGDTWLDPVEGARMEDLTLSTQPRLHHYVSPQGEPALIEALVEKLRAKNGLAVEPSAVLVTAGATGALASALGAILSPGEEVVILSPFWPLIRGIVQAFRGRPVELPFYDRVGSAAEAVAALKAVVGPRTAALYISSPSNPTGRVLPPSWIEAIAAFARSQDLWLLSDETYEDYVFRGEQVSAARFAPERTLTAFSFSKAYGMAGNRVGVLVGPPTVVAQARKVSTHTFYAAPTSGQRAALIALTRGEAWVREAKALYQAVGDRAAAALRLPPPEGSTFLFLDLRPFLDDRGVSGFMEDALDDGVLLAPGESCGVDYAGWARLCFTSAPPGQVDEAVARLSRRLGYT
ncbi:pyridoxal phosphate-dependent aminotransferase [Myxococcota bacterium]|nr:pyridoxal phosphate-dependent aminotransferase [Myxococcota bacterium]